MAFFKISNKKVANALLNTLARCGLKIADVRPTFQSDHLIIDGEIYDSALDHIYYLGYNVNQNHYKNFQFNIFNE